MHKVSVYINNRAGRSSADWRYKLERYLFRSSLKFRSPRSIPELQQRLAKDIQEGIDAVISVGGDGTANTLIQTLAGTNVGLLVVPAGTANDLANELGNKGAVVHMVRSIRGDITKEIDLLSINGRLMATNGGIGLGEAVANRVNQLRGNFRGFKKVLKVAGKNIYTVFVAQDLIAPNLKTYQVEIDAEEFKGTITTPGIFINNQPVLAGRFKIAPFTSNNDGRFNVVLLTHPNRLALIHCFAQVAIGNYPVDDPHFITFETKRIKLKIAGEEQVNFFGDGEVLGSSNFWDIGLVPRSLKVYSMNASSDYQSAGQEQVELM
jgi:diacylglycerol kinase (ATP)